MGFFSRLSRLFASSPAASRYIHFEVKCSRCGEVLEGRLDAFNDPSMEDEDGKLIYFCRKVLIGSGHCHQPVETLFKFDESRHVIDRQVTGGVFIDA